MYRLDGKSLFLMTPRAARTHPKPFSAAPETGEVLALLADLNAWAALLTLTALEILLGIDNVVFVSLLAANLTPRLGGPRVKSDLR